MAFADPARRSIIDRLKELLCPLIAECAADYANKHKKQVITSLLTIFCVPQDMIQDGASDRLALFYALNLESGCYNAAIHACITSGETPSFASQPFVDKYSAYSYRVCGMIDRELIEGLVSKRVLAHEAATIDLEVACPSIMREEREEFKRRKAQKIEIKTSTAYRCSKCGEKRTTITEMMTRSADEPPTLLICCAQCGHRWQYNG